MPQVSRVLGPSSLTEARGGNLQLICVHVCVCVWGGAGIGLGHECCLVGGPVSERSLGSVLFETDGLPMGLPSSSASSSLSLI